jgi:TolB-like protein/class 3 adenylate cyclase/Tfp pilus assembly protein PilF
MAADFNEDPEREIGHVLFMDIVGYSKRVIEEQRELQHELNTIVRASPQFSAAEAQGKLVRLPTGDGMALVFFNSGEAPIRCAVDVARALKDHSQLHLRMGIHTGPVSTVTDVNERSNIAGAGINIAQRVMDLGDAGHILLSKRAAEDLAQYRQWQPNLHDLGQHEAKHGTKIDIINYCAGGVGNPHLPEKLAAERKKQAVHRRRKRALIATAIVLAAVIPLGLSIFLHRSSKVAPALVEKSIAVLPFETFSDDKENNYFADGVQDDILTDLAKVADLKVISRHSVAQLRGTTKTIREIGQALGVAHVLEGSVRKIAGKIHVTTQLIDTRTETQTWAEKYDRDLADIFAIQSEISEAIVTRLKAALSPGEKAAIEEQPTQDPEAYDLYLRARALVYEFSVITKTAQSDTARAVTLLEAAIARDPKFTLAYCLLSEAYLRLYHAEYWNRDRLPKAKEAIETALRIAPNSGQAHLTFALYLYQGERDAAAAEKELVTAAATLPGRAEVFELAGDIAEERGQWGNALQAREKAFELDPRNEGTASNLVTLYTALRRYGDAQKIIDHMVATLPQQSTPFFYRQRNWIELAKGDTKAAMAALDASPTRNLGLAGMSELVAHILFIERQYDKSAEIYRTAEDVARAHNVLPKTGSNAGARGMAFLMLGRIARLQGQTEKANGYFEAARKASEAWMAQHPNETTIFEARPMAWIAEADAALGRKEDALREAQHALEVWPLSRDATITPDIAQIIAVAYVWAGERDAALQLLGQFAKVPYGPTAGDLKLNPMWDEIRSDPRFSRIVADAAVPLFVKK